MFSINGTDYYLRWVRKEKIASKTVRVREHLRSKPEPIPSEEIQQRLFEDQDEESNNINN